MTKWEMPGLVFNSVFYLSRNFSRWLTSYIFSSNKSVLDARAKQDLSRMQKENPEIKQCENLPKIIPYYSGVSQEVIM